MALRAKQPEQVQKRLKLMVYGEAGVGKTIAAAQFPHGYFVDTEKGAENYAKQLKASETVIFQTSDSEELMVEVRSLLTETHEFRTLVIDPITPIFVDALERGEREVGTEFGRHYAYANKYFKGLVNRLMMLDMNVIVTCHARVEYGEAMAKLGMTFDGFKKLDYVFDLVLYLERRGGKRVATVRKTRMEAFPDGEVFEWSYPEFATRCGDVIEEKAKAKSLATPEQVAEITRLMDVVALPDGKANTTDKWFKKANVETWSDMTDEQIAKCIGHVQKLLKKAEAV